MKFLVDENLPPKLAGRLQSAYPGTCHVREIGLVGGSDSEIWTRAVRDGLTILTKDSDFQARSLLLGPPPKVLILALGNCTSGDCLAVIQRMRAEISAFDQNPDSALLILSA